MTITIFGSRIANHASLTLSLEPWPEGSRVSINGCDPVPLDTSIRWEVVIPADAKLAKNDIGILCVELNGEHLMPNTVSALAEFGMRGFSMADQTVR